MSSSGIGERLVDVPVRLRARLARSARARRVLYELRNRRLFADLFQHDRMLADRVRTDAYWAGIGKHVADGDVVIDLGTGSGVLAMFAAKQGARVHAVEHGPIVEAARAVARSNGMTGIEFHRTNSRRLELDEKVDAIVHEQIGDAVFDEHVVANIADLRDRFLKPGGRIYPGRLDMYVEPVQLREDMRAPFASQQRLHGIDFSALRELEAQQPHGYLYRLFRPFPFGHFLSQPEPVVSIDLSTAHHSDLPTEIRYQRDVVRPGHLDGYCVYFDAYFDDDLSFTTSPAGPGTSWATPFLRVPSRHVETGERISLSLTCDDLAEPSSWRWT